jgi:peptidoglycan hydrolase-like protein with peptidoglycan-binding domain
MRARTLTLMAAVLLSACGANLGDAVSSPTGTTTAPDAAPDAPTTDEPATIPATTTTIPFAPLTRTLGAGDNGPDVLALQQRLNELAFDVKAPDGYWGPNTSRAVWAYQGLVLGLEQKDVRAQVTPAMWLQMQQPLNLPPKRAATTATHVEIFLPQQALVVYENATVKLITHISSGSGEEWCAYPRNVPAWVGATTTTLAKGQKLKRVCGTSVTPGGVFKVYRKEKDWWEIPLGKVYNPIYFNAGIAVHGYEDVPFKPASHGCVRIPMHIAEYLPQLLHYQDDVFVWDGVKQPEDYGAQKPPPDKPDPTDTAD